MRCFKPAAVITAILFALQAPSFADLGWVKIKRSGVEYPQTISSDNDAARGAALSTAFAGMQAGDQLLIGPGTYQVAAPLTVKWDNVKILGSGMAATTIKLGNIAQLMEDSKPNSLAVINERENINSIYVVAGVEVADLTVDANWAAQTLPGGSLSTANLNGVNLAGRQLTLRRVRAINWGSRQQGKETFVMTLGSIYDGTPDWANGSDYLIEGCVVESPAAVTLADGVTAISINGSQITGTLTDITPELLSKGHWISGAVIRDCTVQGVDTTQGTVGRPTYMNAFGSGISKGTEIYNNAVLNMSGPVNRAFYHDSYPFVDLTLRDNNFASGDGVVLVCNWAAVQNLRIQNNYIGGWITIFPQAYAATNNILVRNVQISGNTIGVGIQVDNADGIDIFGNRFLTPGAGASAPVTAYSLASNVRKWGNYDQNGNPLGVTSFTGSSFNGVSATISGSGSFGSVRAGAGTALNPSIGFSNDTDTGLFSDNVGSIGISLDGALVAHFVHSTYAPTVGATPVPYSALEMTSGTDDRPGYGFEGFEGTGMYHVVDSAIPSDPAKEGIGFATGGDERARITGQGVSIGGGNAVQLVRAKQLSVAFPQIAAGTREWGTVSGSQSISMPGAVLGDAVILTPVNTSAPPNTAVPPLRLVYQSYVSANNTIEIQAFNSGTTLSAGTYCFRVVVIHFGN